MQPWLKASFDIGHPFYVKLTPVKTRYPLTRIDFCDHIAGSSFVLIEVKCFLKLTADHVMVFDQIVGSCQVNLL